MTKKVSLKSTIVVEPIGVYPVKAPEPCHLIELLLTGKGKVDFGEFTQKIAGREPSSWQVPYDEWILDENGLAGQLAPFPGPHAIDGEVRVAFFFHYLNASQPFLTPWGITKLPSASRRPKRLAFIKYESPC